MRVCVSERVCSWVSKQRVCVCMCVCVCVCVCVRLPVSLLNIERVGIILIARASHRGAMDLHMKNAKSSCSCFAVADSFFALASAFFRSLQLQLSLFAVALPSVFLRSAFLFLLRCGFSCFLCFVFLQLQLCAFLAVAFFLLRLPSALWPLLVSFFTAPFFFAAASASFCALALLFAGNL